MPPRKRVAWRLFQPEEAAMAVIELTTDNFNDTINGPGIVIVDF